MRSCPFILSASKIMSVTGCFAISSAVFLLLLLYCIPACVILFLRRFVLLVVRELLFVCSF